MKLDSMRAANAQRASDLDVLGFSECQQLLRDHGSLRTLEALSKVDLAVLLLAFAHNDAECCKKLLERNLFEVNQLNPHRPHGDVDRYDPRTGASLQINFQSTQLSSVSWRRARAGMIKSLLHFELPARTAPAAHETPFASENSRDRDPVPFGDPYGDDAPCSHHQDRLMSITACPEYANWSFEELRAWETWRKLVVQLRPQLAKRTGIRDAYLQRGVVSPFDVQQPFVSIPLDQLLPCLPPSSSSDFKLEPNLPSEDVGQVPVPASGGEFGARRFSYSKSQRNRRKAKHQRTKKKAATP